MAYGTIKVDNITFDNGGVDKLITVSGLFYSTSGALTVTGAISGGSVTAPTATFTTLTGTTTAGTTATFTSGSFTSLTGVTTTVTSGIFSLGSAAAPSITISGDLNTGIYSPGADQLAIATAGTGRLFVDAGGNVGVGVAPGASLHVAGAITSAPTGSGLLAGINNNYAQVKLYGSTGGLLDFGASGADANARIRVDNSDSALQFFTKSGSLFERMRIDGSGNLGLGVVPSTFSVGKALEIGFAGNTLFGATSGQLNLMQNANYNAAFKYVNTAAASYYQQLSGAHIWYNAPSGTAGNTISFTQAMTLDASGRLGIGTTSPTQLLTLQQTSAGAAVNCLFLNNSSVSANTSVGISFGPNTSNTVDRSAIIRGINESGGTGNATGLQFLTNPTGGSPTEKVRIDSSGRLLVGTSSAQTAVAGVTPSFQVEGGNTSSAALSIIIDDNTAIGSSLYLGKSRGATTGSTTIVASGDNLGAVLFTGADGTALVSAARIDAYVDGTPGANDMPGRLVFSTTADGAASPTEHMRISSNGRLDYTWSSAARSTFAHTSATAADAFGLAIRYTSSPNTTTNDFLYCAVADGATLRATIYSNGGLGNIQSNNVNLSDRNAKKDISLADDTWNYVKEWEIVNYRYVEQPDDADLSLGVIAQQVAESCPELITVFQEAKKATEDTPAIEERLGVKEQQMYWMAIKALQEAQVRIETLETRLSTLEGA